MAELVPLPLSRLATRMLRELELDGCVYDLPREKFFLGDPARDLSVAFQGHRPATPLGPAAGPHSQLAQNLVLSFLGGGRVFELKTVQVNDALSIPRPCIDMSTAGYNVEWSQELKLEASLEEYVKASMLIEILVASGALPLSREAARCVFDLSVGYDLAGIQSERVRAFIRGMMDATPTVDRLRAGLTGELARYHDLDFPTRLADTLTLSTFHGCPPDEIERICAHLLRDHRLHTIVKLNPTLLGPAEARGIFNERLGYQERIPDAAFEKDTRWEEACAFLQRLEGVAREEGRAFGVKLSNTLIVENHRAFFPPSEKVMYLSGLALHVLAMELVGRVREAFGDRFPISFSAGIDKHNFADAVALGLVPVTVCSDLLRTGGYGRLKAYFAELSKRMAACGAATIDQFVLRAYGAPAAGATTLPEARLFNTRAYLARLRQDPRYLSAKNQKPPVKLGSRLQLFDCVTCDKCVPVCPNDANFTYVLPKTEIPVVKLTAKAGGGWERALGEPLVLEERHQLATYADFCNECGNCDVFCPEDGGPYLVKPRFFGSAETFARFAGHDGVFVGREGGRDTVLGRFNRQAFELRVEGAQARFSGEGFAIECALANPEATLAGRAEPGAVVDLTWLRVMDWLRKGVLDGPGVNWVSA